MSMTGRTDAIADKPKFPKERTKHGKETLSANATTFPAATIGFKSGTVVTSNIANGWVASGTNVGNTSGAAGYNNNGPYVINLTASSITLSQNVSGNITAGQLITFSKPIPYKANSTANSYNANTYLVTTTRRSNANSIAANSVAHVGWNYTTFGTGYVKAVTLGTLRGNQYSNGFLTFTANTQYPGGTGANASFAVNANGSIVSVTINSGGSGYFLTPAVSIPFSGNPANAVNTTVTLAMGGRANRIQTETLVAMSNVAASDSASGGLWYAGR